MERDTIMNSELARAIILDNYQSPSNRGIPSEKDYIKINTNNESCIDNLDIYVKLNNNVIEDIKFEGEACVISISSTSIMTKLLIGKTKEEAIDIINNYKNSFYEKGAFLWKQCSMMLFLPLMAIYGVISSSLSSSAQVSSLR